MYFINFEILSYIREYRARHKLHPSVISIMLVHVTCDLYLERTNTEENIKNVHVLLGRKFSAVGRERKINRAKSNEVFNF